MLPSWLPKTLANCFLPIRSKAFPINTNLLGSANLWGQPLGHYAQQSMQQFEQFQQQTLQAVTTTNGTAGWTGYQNQEVYPGKLWMVPPASFPERKKHCHCGQCPVKRDYDRDVYKVRQSALCWLDEQIDRVRERGREFLTGQHSVDVSAEALHSKPNYPKYPPPVSDGIPVRYLPQGDALYAYDQMTQDQINHLRQGF